MSDEEDIKFKRTMSNRTEMVYGHDTIEKISQLKVFLYGLRGLGIEVAKNIILNGCQELSIYRNPLRRFRGLR